MKALILAAGRGTRLGALTANTPKPLLPLTDRPIIDEIILALREAGISEFVLVVGYLADKMRRHLKDGADLGVRIEYIHQDNPQGTGQAVNLARPLLSAGEPFLMTYGDIVISPENYGGMADAFRARPSELQIGLNWVEDPHEGAAVYLDPPWDIDDPPPAPAELPLVVRIIEKPPRGSSTTRWNSAGLMIFSPVIFEYTGNLSPSKRGEYELTDAIHGMLSDQRDIRGYPLRGYWSDVGMPEDLEETRRVWANRNPKESSRIS